MTMRSWIRNLFTRPAVRTVRRAARGFRPSLEVLEDRAVPATFTVLNSLDDGSVGSLRWAVNQANSTPGPDTINFGDGSATGGTNFLDSSMHTIILGGTQLELSNTTGLQTITGPAAGVTVSGGGLSREFQIDASVTASISGLTITDGKSTTSGGGLYNVGTTTLTDCTVSGNSTTNNGGGIYNGSGVLNDSGTVTFTDCTISGNHAGNVGGGVYSYASTTTLTNCTVSSNTATSQGGGLDFLAGTATLTNCTVSGNSAGGVGAIGGGGGLWLQGSTNNTTLTNCTISGNSASRAGGGLLSYSGTATLTNCTVSGNSAASNGGGLRLAGTVTLTNCTVSNNSTTGADGGGGLYINGPTTIGNTIVAGNTAPAGPDVAGTLTSQGHNLIGTPDGSSGWVGSDLIGTIAQPLNSRLAALGNYGGPTQTMPLLPGSPAIDAGSNSLIPTGVTTDQRGDARIVNSTVDIGAFESSGFTIAVTSGSGQSTPPSTAFAAALLATVTANNSIEPVAGGLVTFTPPASGASATLSGSPATISGTGTVSITATANSTSGGYSVSATASGITSAASFNLNNNLAPTFAALSPAAWTAGVAYTGTIGISNGTGPFSLVSTTLPTGYSAVLNGSTITVSNTNPSAAAVSFTVTIKDASGASFTSGSETLTVKAAPTFAALSPAAWTAGVAYTGTIGISNGTGPFSLVSTTLPTGYSTVLSGSTITVSNANPSAAAVSFTVTIKDASGANFTSGSETLTVKAAPTFAALSPAAWTAGVAYTGTIGISNGTGPFSLVSTTLPTGYSTVLSGSTITVSNANPSAAAVSFTVTIKDASGASFTSGSETLTVSPSATGLTQTITFGTLAKQTYGVAPITLGASASSGLAVTYTVVSGPATVSANILTVTGAGSVEVEASQAGNAEFLAAAPVSQSFTVAKAALTITADSDSKTYGALKTFSSTAFTPTGLVTANGDTIAGVTETSTGAPVAASAANYPIVASAATGTGLSNYTISYVNGTLTVNKAALTITANSASKTYGTLKTFGATAFTENGLLTGNTITGVTETSTGAPVSAITGDYNIVASAATGTGLSNYNIQYVSGTLTVNKAALTITSNSASKAYGTLKTFSATAFTQTGLVTANGDTITGVTETSTGAPASAPVATDPIVTSAATGTGLSNYTITYVYGTLTVNKAALTITANSASKIYGTIETFSSTAFTQTGLATANGDTITGVTETSTGAPASEKVGGYPIGVSAATGTGLSNYTISYVNGTLTVNKATLTITANNDSKTYGTLKSFSATATAPQPKKDAANVASPPPPRFTETGLVTANGDTITGVTETSTGAPVAAPVATYSIVASAAAGTGLSNYTISYVSGTLTVNKAALTITANNASKTYGTLKTLSATAFTETGLVTANGNTITGVTETSTGTPVSAPAATDPIAVSAATGTGLSNYTISYVSGTLTVNKAALTITANKASKTYGTLQPPVAAMPFTETGLVTANGDTITDVTETSTGTPASAPAATYPIVASAATGTGLSNYTISYVSGTLTVNKAALTIRAKSDSKTFGTLKTFSSTAFTQTGLVTANGDTITGVTETSTGAPVAAKVGGYPIVASAAAGKGLSNYTISYVNGSLSVNPATPGILGTTALLEGPATGSDSDIVVASGSWSAKSNASWLTTTASATGNGVATFTFAANTGATRSGTLTIAGQTLTVTQAGSTYVAANPLTTLVSGLNAPIGAAVDGSGNVYFADNGNKAIKEWKASTQTVSTLVSGLNDPIGVAVDSSGNVYFADNGLGFIGELHASTQTVTTLVSGLNGVEGVAVDGSGNVYFASDGFGVIVEWHASTQALTTLALGLNNPVGVAVDAAGNVYFADSGDNAIEEWNASTQTVSTLVSGLNRPVGVAVDGSGNVYFADSGDNAIEEWNASTQTVSTLVSSGLNTPSGVAVDGSGNVYLADYGNNALKELSRAFVPGGAVSEGAAAGSAALLAVLPATESLTGIFAPSSSQSWLTIGTIANGVINYSFSSNTALPRTADLTVLGQTIAVTQTGSLPLASSALLEGPAAGSDSDLVVTSGAWKATSNASWLHTSASGTGTGVATFTFDFNTGATRSGTLTIAGKTLTVTQAGSTYVAANALTTLVSGLNDPADVAVDSSGNVYLVATNVLEEWHASSHTVSSLVSGLINPEGVAVDGSGNVYIASDGVISEWHASTHAISTLFSGIDPLSGLAVDAAGNVYFSDIAAVAIDEWHASTQTVSTLVSSGLVVPLGVAVDAAGNVYIADNSAKTIDEWHASTQKLSTLVSFLTAPEGVAVDGSGNVYIADQFSPPNPTQIQEWNASTQDVSTLVSAGLGNPSGVAVDASGNVYISDNGTNAIEELPRAFLPGAVSEGSAAGSGALPAVLPTTQSLTGAFAPTSNQSWLTIGTIANGVVNFTVTANPGITPRIADITLLGQQITVTQAGATITTGNSLLEGPAAGSASHVVATTGAWKATANATWLHTTASGTGKGLATFTFDANTGAPRSGTLTIAGQTLTVFQAGSTDVADNQLTALASTGVSSADGLAVDASGNIYISDLGAEAIKEFNASTKTVTTLVSGLGNLDQGNPHGVAVDGSGNVYFINGNDLDEWHPATQTVSILVSSGLSGPSGLALDASGNVYIADSFDVAIKEWHASTKTVTTLVSGLIDPSGVAVDAAGNVYIADQGGTIDEWHASTQQLTTLVSGLSQPTSVAVDASGNVYISDIGVNKIEEWHASTQQLSTLLSASGNGLAVDASGNLYIAYGNVTELNASTHTLSTLVNSSLSSPSGVAVDVLGNVYIADTGNDAFEEWNASTQLRSTLASSGLNPSSVAVDGSGNVFIAEYIAGVANTDMLEEWNAATQTASAINTLSYNNITYTNNGPTGHAVFDTAGTAGLANDERVLATDNAGTSINGTFFVGNITPTTFQLYFDQAMTKPFTVEDENDLMAPGGYLLMGGLADPQGVAVDAAGNVYIADTGNNAIKEWNASTKAFSTLVSTGLNGPSGVAVDAAGNVYIADTGDNAIKEWNASTKTVSTLVSGLNQPGGVAVDAAGDVYIADTGNNAIKEWNAATKSLGTLVSGLNDPRGVAVDGSGNVYIADTGNNAIEELPRAFLPSAVTEGSAAGSDQLQVLSTTQSLTGVFAPTSNQSWLKVGTVADGVVNFSFSANTTTAAHTAQLTVLGQQITVTQQLTPAFSNLSGPTITYGTATTALSGHLAAGTTFATGANVSITLSSVTQTATVDGSGNFTTTFSTASLGVAAGPYTVTYAFAGNANFSAVTNTTAKLTVTKATPTFSNLSSAAIPAGNNSATISGQVAAGTLAATGSVVITITGANLSTPLTSTVSVDASGKFSTAFTETWAAGTYAVSYQYAGDQDFNAITPNGSTTLVVS